MRASERKQTTTRIDAAGPGRWRWCVVNAHDRMLVHFFGTAPECRALDAAWAVGKRPGLWRAAGTIRKPRHVATFETETGALEVTRTRESLTRTPCVDCHGRAALNVPVVAGEFVGDHAFGCLLVLE